MNPFTNIISHILFNLGFHKNTYHITTKIGLQNYIIFTKRPKLIYLVGKTQKAQQNPFIKPVAIRHPKARCYMAIFLQNLKKPNITLAPIYKSPILFWHLFIKTQILQKPNTILAKTITLYLKPKTIPWQKHIFIY